MRKAGRPDKDEKANEKDQKVTRPGMDCDSLVVGLYVRG